MFCLNKILKAAVLIVCCVLIGAYAHSQEQEDVMVEENTGMTYGVVKEVTGSTILVAESVYNADTDEDEEIVVVYEISPDLITENIGTLSEMEPGTEVDVEYVMKDGKRVAKFIYVYPDIFAE